MDLLQAMQERHSVRVYKNAPIEECTRAELDQFVAEVNEASGLQIQIRYDDPDGFDSRLAHYGSFRNVNNYIVLAGPEGMEDFEEKCGYFGEKIVLKAQMLGLNTCWAALTFNKKMVKTIIPEGMKLCMVIALGYGESQGKAHRSKSIEKILATKNGSMPTWFADGIAAALTAPTAVNQQKFKIGMIDGEPAIKVSGRGPYVNVDLGIVKYHFEIGSGRKVD